MQYIKNKTVLAITAVILILLLLGICFVCGINNILTDFTQSTLQKNAEHIAASIDSEILGNLDTLSALSKQNFLTESNSNNEKVKILDTEAKRKGFIFLAYADPNGCALTNDGQTIWFTKTSYFSKALNGKPNISDDLVDIPGRQKNIIVYSVPVIKENKIIGVLISAVKNDGNLKLIDNITVGMAGSVYVISENGKIVSSYNGEIHDGNFLKYIGVQTDNNTLEKIRSDFYKERSGKNTFIANGIKNIIGYSKIPGTR